MLRFAQKIPRTSHTQAPFPFPISLTDATVGTKTTKLLLSEQRRLRSIRLARKASRLPCEIRATAAGELCCKGKINDKGSRHCQSRPALGLSNTEGSGCSDPLRGARWLAAE
jgi:hypothetical protein